MPSSSFDRRSAAPWIAALLALMTAVLWLLPETAVSESRAALDQYAIAHPVEMLPDSCAEWLGRDHWTAIRVHSSSAQFDRLCMAAGDAESQAGLRRWGLSRGGSPLGWLSAPLLYPDLMSLLAGTWLLAVVIGGEFERRKGRRDGAIALAASAFLPALAWWMLAGLAAQPWLGAAALVSALLAALAVVFFGESQRFWVPGLPEPLELPAWSLLGWWLALRLVSAALFGVERSAFAVEMLAVPLGLGIGFALRGEATAAVRQLWEQGRAQRHAAAGPVAVGPSLGPEAQPGRPPTQPPGRAEDDPFRPPVIELEETLEGAEDPALAALFAEDPPKPVAAAAPLAAALPPQANTLPPQANTLPPQAAALLARGPAKLPEAAQRPAADPVALDDLLADLIGAAPAAPVAGLALPVPAAAAKPVPAQPANVEVAPVQVAVAAVAPSQLPAGEQTIAYAPERAAALRAAQGAAAVPPPVVRLSQHLRRGGDGALLCEIDGEWEALAADLLQGVAVGLIEHRDAQGAQPEIWIDAVTARAARQRPAEVVRLHLSREALEELAPGVPLASAFGQLAEELASGGAVCLPQQPLWPGPPWPRYATAAEFVAMWNRELGLAAG